MTVSGMGKTKESVETLQSSSAPGFPCEMEMAKLLPDRCSPQSASSPLLPSPDAAAEPWGSCCLPVLTTKSPESPCCQLLQGLV